MTPSPPSPSDGSPLPPRHRPTLGNLAKDTTEQDLWAFDDDLELLAGPEETPARPPGREIPAPRERQFSAPRESEDKPQNKTPAGGEERIRMDVNKMRNSKRPSGPKVSQATPEGEFDDLEAWEDSPARTEIGELPVEPPLEPAKRIPEPLAEMPVPPEIQPLPEVAEVPPVPPEPIDEFSPVVPADAKPVSLRPHLGLSKIERAGLASLAILLLAGALSVLVYSLNRLPTETRKAESHDFPIKGGHFSILSAASYWRAPVTDGPNPDTCRRGTELLPVVELGLSGGPAAVRVLFRNDEKILVGDAVTRAVRGDEKLSVAATAGFDDLGMYAAYRTGESKPWTIEVYEAPSENTPGRDFKKLFEMNISTDRR